MIYASSKDALHRRLEGIHIDLQATDFSEITKEASKSVRGRACSVAPPPFALALSSQSFSLGTQLAALSMLVS